VPSSGNAVGRQCPGQEYSRLKYASQGPYRHISGRAPLIWALLPASASRTAWALLPASASRTGDRRRCLYLLPFYFSIYNGNKWSKLIPSAKHASES
jgi:hypothetical protein